MNIDAIKIGAYISKLRKKKDLTQSELAEKLYISHQAVSRWETGQSVPDLSTMVELSKLFDVTIDQLISADNKVKSVNYDSILNGINQEDFDKVVTDIENGENDLKDVLTLSPILKSSQIDKIVDKLGEFESTITSQSISNLAPFISGESLETLVNRFIDKNEEIHLDGLIPFLNQNTIEKLTTYLLEKGVEIDVVQLAPFASTKVLDMLIEKAIEKGEVLNPQELAPFLSRNTLDKLCKSAIDRGEVLIPKYLAPFISSNVLEIITLNALENNIDVSFEQLIPFLPKNFFDKVLLKNK
ncbi:helix-turn-helix transcriptional regulator [Mycoplasmatota bacterium WC44]